MISRAHSGPERLNGRLASPRTRPVLLEIVREGLDLASRRQLPPKPLNQISQREFIQVRDELSVSWGHVPYPQEICRQLSDWAGVPTGWQELKDALADPKLDLKAWDEARLAEPARELGDREIAIALNRIASELAAATLFPYQYDETRETLIDPAAARPAERRQLRLLLPTRGQIETACGSWDEALRIAGLGARPS